MLSRLKIKNMGTVFLVIAMLIFVSACSGMTQSKDGQENSPPVTESPTDNPAASETEAEVNTEVDSGADTEGNKGADLETGSEADKTIDSVVDPEKILEGYYYGVVDMPIVDFELEDLEGNSVRLSDFKGKVVFLNFWATWCPPCREEMPHMQAFYEKYKDEDVVILAVNPNRTENRGVDNSKKAEEKARKFVEEEAYTFPILLDRDDSVWAVYQQRGIPANYMIDKDGIVKYLKPGAFLDMEEMEAFAKALGANID